MLVHVIGLVLSIAGVIFLIWRWDCTDQCEIEAKSGKIEDEQKTVELHLTRVKEKISDLFNKGTSSPGFWHELQSLVNAEDALTAEYDNLCERASGQPESG